MVSFLMLRLFLLYRGNCAVHALNWTEACLSSLCRDHLWELLACDLMRLHSLFGAKPLCRVRLHAQGGREERCVQLWRHAP
jgi:hypothetical protein